MPEPVDGSPPVSREEVENLLRDATPDEWLVGYSVTEGDVWRLYTAQKDVADADSEADANLIAAAPRLAQALLDSMSEVERLKAAGHEANVVWVATEKENARLWDENERKGRVVAAHRAALVASREFDEDDDEAQEAWRAAYLAHVAYDPTLAADHFCIFNAHVRCKCPHPTCDALGTKGELNG